MLSAQMRPISVPFHDDAIKVVEIRWTDADGASIDVLSRKSGQTCNVVFEHVVGFRTLDELDIASMWTEADKADLSSTWLFQVDRGGWFDLESTRLDFYAQHEPKRPSEFLVVGYQACVSILSHAMPRLNAKP